MAAGQNLAVNRLKQWPELVMRVRSRFSFLPGHINSKLWLQLGSENRSVQGLSEHLGEKIPYSLQDAGNAESIRQQNRGCSSAERNTSLCAALRNQNSFVSLQKATYATCIWSNNQTLKTDFFLSKSIFFCFDCSVFKLVFTWRVKKLKKSLSVIFVTLNTSLFSIMRVWLSHCANLPTVLSAHFQSW